MVTEKGLLTTLDMGWHSERYKYLVGKSQDLKELRDNADVCFRKFDAYVANIFLCALFFNLIKIRVYYWLLPRI